LKPFDANGAFAPTISTQGGALRRLAVRGAAATVLSGGIALAIQVVATVVLGRLIIPRDFGLVAMVTTFSALFDNCGESGITEAIVQSKEFNRTQASNLFWITIGIGSLLSLSFAGAGSLLARFYGNALVAPVAVGISATIFLTTTAVLPLGMLRRAMRFPAVARNNIVARVVSVAVSIVLAKLGWGYWALVAGAVAFPLSTTTGAWLMCHWMPGRPRRNDATGPMLRLALHTYGRFSVNYFAHNSDNLLVGWRFGAFSLGFYKKAYDLFTLPATQLVSATTLVAVSALSRVRDDHARYCRYLLGAMAVMAFLGMGMAGDLTLVGQDLIRLLLGPNWDEAGRIFTYFAPGVGAMILYGTHGWIHLSIGRADRWLIWGIFEWIVTILLFLACLPWGPEGIAVAWCLSFWILTVPAMWYAGRPIDLGLGPICAAVWKYVAASLLAGILSKLIFSSVVILPKATGAGSAAVRIAIVSLVFSCLYLAGIVVFYRGIAPLRMLVNLAREMVSMVGGKSNSSTAAVNAEARE
jgi:PST family polysaccharide transporter